MILPKKGRLLRTYLGSMAKRRHRGPLALSLLAAAGALAAPTSDLGGLALLPAPLAPENGIHDLVDVLNERFRSGRPSNDLTEAGVVVHQFDDAGFNTTTRVAKSGGVSKWAPWTPCPKGQWCNKFSDRFSTSVINAGAPYAFSAHNGGLVISADTASSGALCAWATDGRSFRAARACIPKEQEPFRWSAGWQTTEEREGCVPGCFNGKANQLEDTDTPFKGMRSPTWCTAGAPDAWCPWRPEQLQNSARPDSFRCAPRCTLRCYLLPASARVLTPPPASPLPPLSCAIAVLEQQTRMAPNNDCAQGNGCRYNELVLNSSVWVAQMPRTVEAVFALRAGHNVPGFAMAADLSGTASLAARMAHRDFLAQYATTDEHVPLLELDLTNAVSPFRELRNPLLLGTRYMAHSEDQYRISSLHHGDRFSL